MQIYFVDVGRVISLKDLRNKVDAPDESAENLRRVRGNEK